MMSLTLNNNILHLVNRFPCWVSTMLTTWAALFYTYLNHLLFFFSALVLFRTPTEPSAQLNRVLLATGTSTIKLSIIHLSSIFLTGKKGLSSLFFFLLKCQGHSQPNKPVAWDLQMFGLITLPLVVN